MTVLSKALAKWFGRGASSITTPPMDGAFRPNDLLDAATTVLESPAPDDLAETAQGLVVSSGRLLLRADSPGDAPVAEFDAEIGALAGLPDGGLAVGLVDGRIVFVGGQYGGKTIATRPEVKCITALTATRDGAVLVANGSARYRSDDWKRDLMEKNATGSLWRLEPASAGWTQRAANLAYPNGLLDDGDSIVVSESWRCALTRVSRQGGGRAAPVLQDLPAYPGRLSRGADGTVWLALFAPRSQLVEFVLSEDAYRRRMIDEIDAEYWVAPCLRSGSSPLEPTQQGGVKQLGVLKPWSPTRSYGLIARLDEGLRPTLSLHSRSNGRRHGVTSCLERKGRIYFASKGDGIVASYAYGGTNR
jgi:sugar lactone lactonase YvrE